jgi:dTDP-4-amino-4,6-dideoxygalactose transaminase
MPSNLSRRFFLGAASAGTLLRSRVAGATSNEKPALLGGKPVRAEQFPGWPVVEKNDETQWMEVLRSKEWYRRGGHYVDDFERTWAEKLGAKQCVATNGGTTALWAALNALEIGPKDEVIVPPYTFIATINVVLLQHALPVFVDSDRKTSQIDADKIEAAITPRTRAILPVHLGGAAANMDRVMEVARKHKLYVVEDACQSHLAEWRGKKVGTLGDLGCFSFQASKNLNCGEGGALVTNNEEWGARAEAFHNNGNTLRLDPNGQQRDMHGCNLRMTEFQGALLLSQLARLDEQARTREQNAQYLSKLLDEIGGIEPARMYEGCTRNAYHLYMFRYDPQGFDGLPRAQFLKALNAEGIPCSGGYRPLNQDPFLKNTFATRAFQAIYSPQELAAWHERNHLPENDKLCEEALWLGQNRLLGPKQDMEQVAAAIRKIQRHATALRVALA